MEKKKKVYASHSIVVQNWTADEIFDQYFCIVSCTTILPMDFFYITFGDISPTRHMYIAKVLQMKTLCSTENNFLIQWLTMYEMHHTIYNIVTEI